MLLSAIWRCGPEWNPDHSSSASASARTALLSTDRLHGRAGGALANRHVYAASQAALRRSPGRPHRGGPGRVSRNSKGDFFRAARQRSNERYSARTGRLLAGILQRERSRRDTESYLIWVGLGHLRHPARLSGPYGQTAGKKSRDLDTEAFLPMPETIGGQPPLPMPGRMPGHTGGVADQALRPLFYVTVIGISTAGNWGYRRQR
jgi:hypothetical protein